MRPYGPQDFFQWRVVVPWMGMRLVAAVLQCWEALISNVACISRLHGMYIFGKNIGGEEDDGKILV